MSIEFKLPDIGEGIAEGEIVKWLVKEGQRVEEHQAIVEVMTDKATVEVPAPAAGTITKILAAEGATVPVGAVIFHLDAAAASAPAAGRGRESAAPGASSQRRSEEGAPSRAGEGARAKAPEPRRAESAAPAELAAARSPAARSAGPSGGKTIEFKLPDIGEGIAEGEIVRWLVKEGERVEEHQAVVEVMTDKATVEVPAPAAGTIAKINAAAGATVPVGAVIFHLRTSGAPAAEPAPAKAPARETAGDPVREKVREPARETAREHIGAGARAGASVAARAAPSDEKILAVPSARRVARELGIDLAQVSGSGRRGIVRRADVEAHARAGGGAAAPARTDAAPVRPAAAASPAAAAAPPRPAPVAVPAGERETRTPFRGVRRKIAEAMARSAFTAAHFTVVEEVNVTELVRLRTEAKALGAEQGVKVTYLPFIMKAAALALARYPKLNGRLDEEAQELVHFGYVNLGIAMDTDQGLIVPVIREVQSKGVLQLAAELEELAERTRAGKVKAEELKGSTFSITNAGNIGGIHATPIINFPDIAILGVHRIMKRPGVVETPQGDRIEVREYMNFSASVDHRLADGADAARFLVHVKRLLESPGLLAV